MVVKAGVFATTNPDINTCLLEFINVPDGADSVVVTTPPGFYDFMYSIYGFLSLFRDVPIANDPAFVLDSANRSHTYSFPDHSGLKGKKLRVYMEFRIFGEPAHSPPLYDVDYPSPITFEFFSGGSKVGEEQMYIKFYNPSTLDTSIIRYEYTILMLDEYTINRLKHIVFVCGTSPPVTYISELDEGDNTVCMYRALGYYPKYRPSSKARKVLVTCQHIILYEINTATPYVFARYI